MSGGSYRYIYSLLPGGGIMDKYCCNCKYFGEVLNDNLHICNNDKSIYKACLEMATGCEKFEPQESEEE